MRFVRLILGNLLVFACIMLVAACGLEIWARTQPRNSFLRFDPVLGYALRAGAEGVYRGTSMLQPHPDIRTEIRINFMGLRGPERSPVPEPGRPRALVVGDSFVQAFEVPYEKTFYALAEERARDEGLALEVIPMGVMGYGQAQQLLWLRDRGVAFRPELVVVLVFLKNDVSDNSYAMTPTRIRPYFELIDGELELVRLPGSAGRFKYELAEWLRSYRVYKEIAGNVGVLRKLAGELGLSNLPDRWNRRRDTPVSSRVRDGFELTFALLRDMQRVAAGAGSDFAIAYYGDRDAGAGETARDLLADFCREAALDCLDLNEALAAREKFVLPLDDHWNEAGHRVVAGRMWERWFAALASRGGAR